MIKVDCGSHFVLLNLKKEIIKIDNCVFSSGKSKTVLKPFECAIIKK